MIKYFLSIWLCLGFSGLLNAQSVGIGIENANNNAVLELVSPNNNQGFLVPRLTTAQRTNSAFLSQLSATDNGLLVFDSNENTFYYWQTDQWLPIRYGADQDPDPTNEIQDLNLSGNTLRITGNTAATPIDLTPFSGTDTDQQRIDIFQLTGTVLELSLERDNESTRGIDLSIINTDNQGLLLNGNNLSIENGTGSVDLSSYINDADADPLNEIQTVSVVGTDVTLSGGGTFSVNDADASPTNELQTANRSGNVITLSGSQSSFTVDDADADITNELQVLSKTNGMVTLSRNGGSFTDDVGLLTVAVNATLTGNGTAALPLSLADGAVSTLKLADNAVTGAKVADGSLTDLDIASLGWGKLTSIPADIADGDQVNDADADPANELQTVTLLKNVVTLSGNGGSFSIDDLDADPANEIQNISKIGNTVTLSNNGGSFNDDINDADADPLNEIQTISVLGTDVTLSNGGGTFSLNDADADPVNELQTVSKLGSTVTLSNNGGSFNDDINDADADPLNEIQTISVLGTDVTLSNGGGTFSVNDADADPSNELQTAAKVGNTVTLSGNQSSFTVDDADASPTNELQTLSQVGTTVTLSGNGGSVDVRDFQPYAFKATSTSTRNISILPGENKLPFDAVIYDITGSYDATRYSFVPKDAGIFNFQGLVTFDQQLLPQGNYYLRLIDPATQTELYRRLITTNAGSSTFSVDLRLSAGTPVQFDLVYEGLGEVLTAVPSEVNFFFSGHRIY